MADLSEKLKSTLEAGKIYSYISGTLVNSFHAKTVSVLIFNKKTRAYEVKYDFGHRGGEESFTEERGFFTKVIQQSHAIVVEEIREREEYRKYEHTFRLLKKYDIDILVPLNLKDEVIGLLALGPKESGDIYNHDDLRVLGFIGAQAAIAIENAILYEETRNFNVKLQNEVEKATRDLRAANERLKKLDEAKSEFISIASHQLRTPLTVIKGYISMILEGSFGELTSGEQDSLSKVYESNERLIKLVENLLNISRIESGRLQFNYEVMQLEVLAASVFEELEKIAKGKKLKFKFVRSKKKLPPVRIDEEKVRQVILNLIDNAIKYTRKGSVTVSVGAADEGGVQVSVQDSGMGINPEDIDNLFKKFSRGSGTALVHTEGSGLGLYVAKQMVEAQGGRIWAESDGEGKGSRFCFVLPPYKL